MVLSDLEINTRPCDQYREYPGVYYSAPGPMMPRGMPGLGAAVEENIAFDNVAMLPGMEMEDLPSKQHFNFCFPVGTWYWRLFVRPKHLGVYIEPFEIDIRSWFNSLLGY